MNYWTPDTLADYATERGKPITPRHIRRFCESGRIKATKPGRDWIIDNSEAERWIAEWTKSK